MNSLGKQAVRPGSINQHVEISSLFLFVYVFKTNSQYSLKFLVTTFLQNGRVLYFYENKAYLKLCLNDLCFLC